MRECNGVYIDAECSNCELNAGKVCMGYGTMEDGTYTYGKPIEELTKVFPGGCDGWEVSFYEQENWFSEKSLKRRYDTAVKLYVFLIEYARNKNIDSLKDLKESVRNDSTFEKYEKEMYLARLEKISNKVKRIFFNRGVNPYDEFEKIKDIL